MGNAASIAAPGPGLMIAAGAAWPPLCTVAAVLRLCNSRCLDDWLIVPALVLLWGQGVCLVYGTARHALGYMDPDPPPGVDPETYVSPEGTLSSQLLYAVLLIQIPCLTLIKLSFVFFYRRIFSPVASHSRGLTIFLNTVAGVLIAWTIAFWFAELFVCRDILLIWSGTDDEQAASCSQFLPFDQAFASTDFIFDLMIFVIPIPLVFRLNLSTKRKWGVLAVFSLGGLAIAASITRFVVFTYEAEMGFTICLYWTCLESGVALLCSCLPSIFGFYTNIRRRASERSRSRGYGSNSGLFGRRQSEFSRKGRARLGSGTSNGTNDRSGEGDKIRVTQLIRVDTEEMALETMPSQQRREWSGE